MRNRNFTFLKGIFLLCVLGAWQMPGAQAQFGCDQGVVISDGYTEMGITTPGAAGPEDWNVNPTDTDELGLYWDDDVYLFEYTAGDAPEQISMTIFTRNAWNGIGIFENCDGTTFSSPLAEDASGTADIERNVSALIDANQTIYIAVGQWGTPNGLDFDVIEFSASSCITPYGGEVDPSTLSANVSWSDTTGGTAWNVQYGAPGFSPFAGEGTTVSAATNVDFEITGLESATEYELYIQTDCGEETSAWAGPVEFATLCEVFSTPFVENFEGDFPTLCWQEADAGHLSEGPTEIGSGSWGTKTFLNEDTQSQATSVNIFASSKQDWLISPEIELTAGIDYQIDMDLAVVDFGTSTFSALGSDDSLSVVISEDGGESWTELQTFDSSYVMPEGGDHIIIPLTGYAGNIVRIAFWASEGSVDDDADVDAMIDNFWVRETPTCLEPQNFAVDSIWTDTVSVSWLAGADEINWNIQYGAPGFDPFADEGTTIPTDSVVTDFDITVLDPATEYQLYIQAVCGEGDESYWVGPLNILTACAPITPEYIQDFESDEFPPVCWEEADGGDLSTGPTDFGGGSWIADDFMNMDESGAPSINLWLASKSDWLISPEFDLTGTDSYILDFNFAIVDYADSFFLNLGSDDSVSVAITIDGGETWEELQTWDTNYEMPEGGDYVIIPLDAYAGNIVRIGIWASEGDINDAEDTQVMFDNFRIRETPICPEPYSVTAEPGLDGTALLSWSVLGDEASWNVQYGAPGFDPVAGEGTSVVADTNTDFELTGLDFETEYDVYVQAICTPEDTSSIWSYPTSFTTLASCPVPVDFEAVSVTNDAAYLSWTPIGLEAEWTVQYGAQGFSPQDGEGTSVTAATSDNFEVAGLDPNTEYDFYVQAICEPGVDSSYWVGDLEILTECDPYLPDYLQEYDTFLPECWKEASGGDPSTGPVEFGTSGWTDDEFSNAENGSQSARENVYSTGDQEWLISPLIDLSAGGPYQVDFKFDITDYADEFSAPLGTDDEVHLLASIDYGASWDTLMVFDSSYVSPEGGELIIHELDATYEGEIVKFAVWATSGTVNDPEDNDVFVDNFRVREVPTCLEPLTLNVDTVTSSSVEISWTTLGDETQWNVIYGEAGFDPEAGEGTVLTADNNEGFVIDGLDAATPYEIYVQGVCVADTDLSLFTGPVTGTTACAPYIPTYEQDFTQYLPLCWVEADNGDATTGPEEFGTADWFGGDLPGGDASAMINIWAQGDKEWLISPEFDLAGSANFQLEFDLAILGFSSDEPAPLGSDDELQVLITTDGGTTWEELQTFDADYTSTAGETMVISLADYEDEIVQIAYYATDGEVDDAEDNYIYIDNFLVRECIADASFSYPSDTLCLNLDGLTLPNITGTTGGTFSAPDGLEMDPETGEIDPSQSNIGEFDVLYEVGVDSTCSDSQEFTVIIDICDNVEEIDPLTAVGVYPNPASNVLNIDFSGIDEKVSVEVMDMAGKVVLSETFANPSNEEINVSKFESGLYMIRLSTNTSTVTKRVVVNK